MILRVVIIQINIAFPVIVDLLKQVDRLPRGFMDKITGESKISSFCLVLWVCRGHGCLLDFEKVFEKVYLDCVYYLTVLLIHLGKQCLRSGHENGTNGFFVAVFVRKTVASSLVQQTSKRRKKHRLPVTLK